MDREEDIDIVDSNNDNQDKQNIEDDIFYTSQIIEENFKKSKNNDNSDFIVIFGVVFIVFIVIIIMSFSKSNNNKSDIVVNESNSIQQEIEINDKKNTSTQNEIKLNNYKMYNVSVDVPDYWKIQKNGKDEIVFYVENEEKFTKLEIYSSTEDDENYEVTFDGLSKDNENMIKTIEAKYSNCIVKENSIYEKENLKGIIYSYELKKNISLFNQTECEGKMLVFPSSDDRKWFWVILTLSKEITETKYEDDYIDIINSIAISNDME